MAISKFTPRGFNRSQYLSALSTPRLSNLRSFSYLSRSFSALADKTVCRCHAELPQTERIIDLFRERNLRQLTQEIRCPYFNSFQFTGDNDCKLVEVIEEIATPLLKNFRDVAHVGNSRLVLLESLREIPEGDLGDLTGDHGKQMAKFLKDCLRGKLISNIGAVFDIGGQNISTVNLISNLINNPDLPCMIVDINPITPAISKLQPNVKYVIEDALTFFSSPTYQDSVSSMMSEKPSVFIFNNMLNVLKAEDGWKTLEAAWDRLRNGDYLVISGLVPEQFQKHGFMKYHEIDGIIEFHHKSKGFYKSALAATFFEYVKMRLKSSSILVEETFTFSIETKPLNTMDVKGRRLLTLKKVVI